MTLNNIKPYKSANINYLLNPKNLIIVRINKVILLIVVNHIFNLTFSFKNFYDVSFTKTLWLVNLKYYLLYYYKLLYACFSNFYNLYYIEMVLEGVYYRIKYYKHLNILGLILGYNHYVLLELPENVFVKIHMKKRRFFFYGFYNNALTNFVTQVVNLKFPNLFKGKGVKVINFNYRLKQIKKKK